MITESCHVSKYLFPSSPFTTNSPHPSPLPEREGNKGTFDKILPTPLYKGGYKSSGADLRKYIQSIFARHPGRKSEYSSPIHLKMRTSLLDSIIGDMIAEIAGMENIVVADIFESHIVEERYFTMKGEKIDVVLDFFPFEFFLTDLDFCENFFQFSKLGSVQYIILSKASSFKINSYLQWYMKILRNIQKKSKILSESTFLLLLENSRKIVVNFSQNGDLVDMVERFIRSNSIVLSPIPKISYFNRRLFQRNVMTKRISSYLEPIPTSKTDSHPLPANRKNSPRRMKSRVTLVFVNPEEKSEGITL